MVAFEHIAEVERFGADPAVLFVCEHASRAIPAEFGNLGLGAEALTSHVAWDPGALPLARAMARATAGRLIHATASRLLYDLNRPPEAVGAVPEQSEVYAIPGNRGLRPEARDERVARFYRPWVAALEAEMDRPTRAVVTVHSFTPVYFGVSRDTRIGLLHDDDSRLVDAMLGLAAARGVPAERNRPYGPEDGVTHTLRAFAAPRGLLNVMIEVRNDLLTSEAAIGAMAEDLTGLLTGALASVPALERQAR